VQDRADRVGRRRAAKRRPTGQHLVQHGTETENVGAMIRTEPARLLRRHVGCRAEYNAESGSPHRDGGRPIARCIRISELRETEVENL
jgi:hypothetical protein